MRRKLTVLEAKSIRTGTNLSQRAFALKYGIPVRTLQEWEQGRAIPPDYVLDLIKKNVEVEFDFDNLRITPKTTFKVITKHFLNAERIHPIMQKDIFSIIEDLKKDSNVVRIIIFGSSVTSFVKSESDIDVYIELKENKIVERTLIDHPADYWTNFTVTENMLDEIKAKGVIVYES